MLAVVFSFTACMKNPTEGFKVEGSIANFQDCPDDRVMAFVCGDYPTVGTKISESKFENNYFSMFLPYELKDKYCDAIGNMKYIFFDSRFEDYVAISNENVKIADVWFHSNKKYYFGGNIRQFGYTEDYDYNNGPASVTLVKTQYVYAQSAVSIRGEYDTYSNGEDQYGNPIGPHTVKVDLLLQKGWNIVYYIGNYISKPNTYLWEIDTAIINVTAEKPENIELKWYYRFRENYRNILKNENARFMNWAFMMEYNTNFMLILYL